MAVQAQYPANVLLLNRGETERKNKEMETNFPPTLLEQAPVFFTPSGGNVNPRKRGREAAMAVPSAILWPQTQQQMSLLSLQAQARTLTPTMLGLPQLQSSTPSLVSTGLQLSFNDHNQSQNQKEQLVSILSSFSEDLATEINQQKNEIEQFLRTQGEQLRREMAAKRKNHYRILLATVEKSLGNKLREKEAEVAVAARRAAELQDRLNRLRTESMAWQAKAMAEQSAAASLQAQLQQVASAAAIAAPAGEECYGESPAEDAGSAFVDPDRSNKLNRLCWSCHTRPASVVLLPCRHLCVCPACDSAGAANDGCPACGCTLTGSLEVYFS
ncbi:hypothetical protein KFK09_029021 [Dendrobium nobile]|uniref:RING-type domain-containing protein n=1 Tax=Dendrobium nobile TaxID=94219 RepID=A0A8T3A536_DENNO|nr:hypothetical protein KFK09_029021 [Dendrobium nobile]